MRNGFFREYTSVYFRSLDAGCALWFTFGSAWPGGRGALGCASVPINPDMGGPLYHLCTAPVCPRTVAMASVPGDAARYRRCSICNKRTCKEKLRKSGCNACRSALRRAPEKGCPVIVRRSTIKDGGRGLFTTRRVEEGKRLCTMGGTDTTDIRDVPGTHLVELRPGIYRDGTCTAPGPRVAGLGHFANTVAGAEPRRHGIMRSPVIPDRPNAYLVTPRTGVPSAHLVASRNLAPNVEIFVSYGADSKKICEAPPAKASKSIARAKRKRTL